MYSGEQNRCNVLRFFNDQGVSQHTIKYMSCYNLSQVGRNQGFQMDIQLLHNMVSLPRYAVIISAYALQRFCCRQLETPSSENIVTFMAIGLCLDCGKYYVRYIKH